MKGFINLVKENDFVAWLITLISIGLMIYAYFLFDELLNQVF